MELKTIEEIRSLNVSGTASYLRYLTSQRPFNYDRNEIGQIIACFRNPNFQVVIPDFVVHYLTAFILEHFDSIEYKEVTTEEARVVSNPNLILFSWKTPIGDYRGILITQEQVQYINNIVVPFTAGVIPEDVTAISTVLLGEDTDNMESNRDLLLLLGLISNTTVTQIPTPSETLNIDESTARFSSAIWFEEIQKKTIILAGLGGIGSYVAFLLGRMHPNGLFLYDDDKVEAVNMAGQLYCQRDINSFKVDAITHTINQYCAYNKVCAIRERFTATTEPTDIMICGFDNMAARTTFFQSWKQHISKLAPDKKKQCLFIDGRLAAEELQVLCIRGDDDYNIRRYEVDFLFSDEEADTTECSYKQTTYMANMIGSIIVNLFTNFVANCIEDNLRDLPFFTSYSADSMMFKTEQ